MAWILGGNKVSWILGETKVAWTLFDYSVRRKHRDWPLVPIAILGRS